MFSGAQDGSRISSGGITGTWSQDQRPNSESQILVNTRLASMPPPLSTKSAARRICSAVGWSPASRSATQASAVVDRSGGPP